MANKFYGSVNSQAKLVADLYGSGYILSTFSATLPQQDESGGSDLVATAVAPAKLTTLINANSDAQGFLKSGWSSGGEIVLWIANVADVTIQLKTSKGSTYLVYNRTITPWGNILPTIESDYGVTITGTMSSIAGTVKITMPISPTVQSVTKEIQKLYGSVNGQTKLIYQA